MELSQRDNYIDNVYEVRTNGSVISNSIAWCLIDRYNYHHWLRTNSLLIIGHGECDIHLKSRSVDPQHAILSYDAEVQHYKIKDLASKNGTFVNEVRIPEDTYVFLDNCDSLRFGYDSTVFRIQKFFTNVGLPQNTSDAELPTRDIQSSAIIDDLPEWAVRSSNTSSLPMAECPMCTDNADGNSADVKISTKNSLSLCPEHKEMQAAESPRIHTNRSQKSDTKADTARSEKPSQELPSRTSFKKKKALELYGQPDWWGEEEDATSTPSPRPPAPSKDSPPVSKSAEKTPAEKPMEVSHVRRSSKPSEAFTISIPKDTDSVDSDQQAGDFMVKDTLSRFVPSKIRKSFQEREEVKRKKVEELRERTKKVIEKQTNAKNSKAVKMPIKSSGTPNASGSKANSSQPKRSSAVNSPNLKKENTKSSSKNVQKKATEPVTSKSEVIKPSRNSVPTKQSRVQKSVSQAKPRESNKNILFDKLFSSRSDNPNKEKLPEHDMYSEAAGYSMQGHSDRPADSSPVVDEDAQSEAGTYTISESEHEEVNEELEDIEFQKLEAFADSLEISTLVDSQPFHKPSAKSEEFDLKSGPKWMSDVVNGNGDVNYDHSPRDSHIPPPQKASKSSSECSPRRSHKSSANSYSANSHSPAADTSELGSPMPTRRQDPTMTQRTAVSDVMSTYPGLRHIRAKPLPSEMPSVNSSLDTACLLQDTATVLQDMEARLARHASSSENIPYADEETFDLSDGEGADGHEYYRRGQHNLMQKGGSSTRQKRGSMPPAVSDVYSEDEAVTARSEETEGSKTARSSRVVGLRFSGVRSSPRSNVSLGTRILQRSRDNLVQRFDYGRHSLKMATSNTHPPGRAGVHVPIPQRVSPQRSSVWQRRGGRPISLHEATLRHSSHSSSSTEDLPSARHSKYSEFSRDLERLAKKEDFYASGRRSAFSPLNSPTWSDSPGPYRSQSAAHLSTGEEDPTPQVYESVLASSLFHMASKLRRCSDDLLGRLRRSRHISRTPSPVEDVLAPPAGEADSAGSEMQDNLHACIYNLQAVQYHLQIIERAIFPQAKSGRNSALGSCSEGDYLMERERINNEIRGFAPIEPAFPATDMKFYTDYKM